MVSTASVKKLPDKLLNRADVFGGLMGFFGRVGSIEGLSTQIQQLARAPKAPNISQVLTDIVNNLGGPLVAMVLGAVITWVDIPGTTKYGNGIFKFGLGLLGGISAATVMMLSHNPDGGGAGAPAGSVTTAGNVVPFSTAGRASYPAPAITTWTAPRQ